MCIISTAQTTTSKKKTNGRSVVSTLALSTKILRVSILCGAYDCTYMCRLSYNISERCIQYGVVECRVFWHWFGERKKCLKHEREKWRNTTLCLCRYIYILDIDKERKLNIFKWCPYIYADFLISFNRTLAFFLFNTPNYNPIEWNSWIFYVFSVKIFINFKFKMLTVISALFSSLQFSLSLFLSIDWQNLYD